MRRRRILIPGLLALATAGASAAPLAAQTMRTFSASRPVGGERLLRVSLDFGGGEVMIRASKGELYSAQLRYDAARYAPVQQYDPRTGILTLGSRPTGAAGIRVTSRAQLEQDARFELSPDVPLELSVSLGSSEAGLDLGGLKINELTVRANATRGVADFSAPNRGACRSATFAVGGGRLDVMHLAHSGCPTIRIEGGVGTVALDFGGEWQRDMAIAVDLAVGGLALRVPRGVGVRLSNGKFLTALETQGFVKSDGGWTTPNFAAAPRKLTVRLATSMVGVNVVWVD